jgi:hypothetical protein
MIMIILQPEVAEHPNTPKEGKVQEAVRKVLYRVKVMTMFQMSEKGKKETKKPTLQGKLTAQQGNRLSRFIRIQIEETKGKVRALSPAALQFIGPGDD